MRIKLDTELCEGYATCVAAAPDLFDFDEDADKAVLLIELPDSSLTGDVDEAIRACPVRAISRDSS